MNVNMNIELGQTWYGPQLVNQGSPPYVRFEDSYIEDREATIREGSVQYKEVVMVIVQAAGSKDTFTKAAEDWLNDIEAKAKIGMYPQEWIPRFREMYKLYQEGKAIPEIGTPIVVCSFLNKAEQQACINANVRTLEALSEANEQAIAAIGLNGRLLKNRAITALQQKEGGKVALEIEKLRLEIEELKKQNEEKLKLLEEQKMAYDAAMKGKAR